MAGAISDAFAAHGMASNAVGSLVRVGEDLRIRVRCHLRTQRQDGATIQLDIETETDALGASSPLMDSFAGIGPTQRDAAKNAFGKFLIGSFHVMAEALTSHRCDSGQVEWEDWLAPGAGWKVCSGPLLTQATKECRTSSQYGDVLARIRELFVLQAEPGPHWVRIFIAFLRGQVHSTEVMLDGVEWRGAQELCREARWTPSDEYESLRHLLVALPGTP